MEHDGGSAERELLKAIEAGAGIPSSGPEPVNAPKAAPPVSPKKVVSLAGAAGAVESRLSFSFNQVLSGYVSRFNSISLSDVKNFVVFLTLVAGAWVVIAFAQGFIALENIPKFAVATESQTEVSEKTFAMDDFAHYSEVIGGRNIFKAAQKKADGAAAVPILNTLAQNLKIVGLSWFPEKSQRFAMIEDSNTGITYFLAEGDSLLSFVVYKIGKSSVTLRYRGGEQEVELR
ncbi:MAG TPA: hypothetical protein PKY78_03480 [Candidatus Omnitrophota bacterium]|nr:hypothetical protein [Candidatus Omnitrophota bacterium]